MTVEDLIAQLQNYVAHGGSPKAEVLAYDPDTEAEEPVTGMVVDMVSVTLHTDDPA